MTVLINKYTRINRLLSAGTAPYWTRVVHEDKPYLCRHRAQPRPQKAEG